ncbi:LexA family protein [Paenibacillus eucommiae]|uniref:Repressor LexA n=1 Tax=Paenibacillus eucommiae TaxID=1355755 RepID=A0ABS4IU16_9BACL|nr:S24 family peptidase [Paenibacillus eucommiae]MBP1991003.1 repressor LexA [Paenibacillus eucommiae]
MSDNELSKIFSENFKRLRKFKQLKQKDMAKLLGVSNSIVSDWEKGVKLPRGTTIQKIAEIFEVQQNELFIKSGVAHSTLTEMINLPIVSRITSGNGQLSYEDIERYEPTPRAWVNEGDYFYLRARDDGTAGARIHDGDLLLIRKQKEIEDGEITAVLVGQEALLRRAYRQDNNLILQSENPKHPPIICEANGDYQVQVIGTLKKAIINY